MAHTDSAVIFLAETREGPVGHAKEALEHRWTVDLPASRKMRVKGGQRQLLWGNRQPGKVDMEAGRVECIAHRKTSECSEDTGKLLGFDDRHGKHVKACLKMVGPLKDATGGT